MDYGFLSKFCPHISGIQLRKLDLIGGSWKAKPPYLLACAADVAGYARLSGSPKNI
jgi:hypothetical protein